MSNKSGTGCSTKSERRSAHSLAAAATVGMTLAIFLQFVPAVTGVAAATASENDAQCIACHSMKMQKTLSDGGSLSLHVPTADFAESVHGRFGCISCHRDIAASEHLKARKIIDNRRDYSVEKNQSCRACHAAKFKQYEGSIHASLVAEGNDAAPLCSDCHNAHAIKPMAIYEPITGQPCKNCHENIFEAYAESVHGQARANGNVIRPSHIQAPICADCHQSHEITAVAASDRLKATCLSCHDGASVAHEAWLPNAGLHLDVVACPACHAPMAERRIDLQLIDNLTQAPVGQHENDAVFAERARTIDAAGDGLDPLELWSLVRQTTREGQATEVTLRGRMEVTTGVDAHRLAVKASAVRDCQSCHQYGADAFRTVTVSIARPDGRKQRYEADSKVLNSVVSVDSVSDFYTLGGTRVRLLDGLLVVGLLAGIAVPIGHMTIGRYLRNKR